MDEKPDEKAGCRGVTLWLDPKIIDTLDAKAKDIERSRSWMASFLLKQALGIQPDDEKKKP
jgi:predicted transcriptional regulator